MSPIVAALRGSPQARRYAAAAVVLILVVISVLLWGRDAPEEPLVEAVAASQPWTRGGPPGDHVVLEVPERLSAMFVSPDDLSGTVAATYVPAGVLVSPAMLVAEQTAFMNDDSTLLRVRVNSSLWPEPGPRAGQVAVLSATAGGCSIATVELVAADDDTVILEATPSLASLLAPESWWVWQAPESGWPACPTAFEIRDISGFGGHSSAEPLADGPSSATTPSAVDRASRSDIGPALLEVAGSPDVAVSPDVGVYEGAARAGVGSLVGEAALRGSAAGEACC